MIRLPLFVSILFSCTWVLHAQESIDVLHVKRLDGRTATEKHVLVTLEVWCDWCHRMTKNSHDKKVPAFFQQHYVPFPIPGVENRDQIILEQLNALELATMFKDKNAGFPIKVSLNAPEKLGDDTFKDNIGDLCFTVYKKIGSVFMSEMKANTTLADQDKKNLFAQIFIQKEFYKLFKACLL